MGWPLPSGPNGVALFGVEVDSVRQPGETGHDVLAMLDRVQSELDDVEHALQRLDDGTYGTCDTCGCEIASERLEIMPSACFCGQHQSGRAT